MDARRELEKTKVLLEDEQNKFNVMNKRFTDAMRRAESAESQLERAKEKLERITKRHAILDDEDIEESKSVESSKKSDDDGARAKRELRRANQNILMERAINALLAGKSVVKYHSRKSGKANRWIAYNAATKMFGWANSTTPKPIKDKVRSVFSIARLVSMNTNKHSNTGTCHGHFECRVRSSSWYLSGSCFW